MEKSLENAKINQFLFHWLNMSKSSCQFSCCSGKFLASCQPLCAGLPISSPILGSALLYMDLGDEIQSTQAVWQG